MGTDILEELELFENSSISDLYLLSVKLHELNKDIHSNHDHS